MALQSNGLARLLCPSQVLPFELDMDQGVVCKARSTGRIGLSKFKPRSGLRQLSCKLAAHRHGYARDLCQVTAREKSCRPGSRFHQVGFCMSCFGLRFVQSPSALYSEHLSAKSDILRFAEAILTYHVNS